MTIATDDLAVPELVTAAGADTALIDGATGTAVDYATLRARIGAVSAGLAARGLRPGDVLAVWAPNEPRWAGVALAAMAAGAAVTGIPPGATEREAGGQLADADARVVIAATPMLEGARAAADGRTLIPFDALAELLAPAPAVALPGPDAVALLPYSSGTTGLPKGVMLTHRNVVAGARQVEQRLGLTARDTVLALAPFCHVMGFVVALCAPLLAGARVVTMPRFDLETLLALVERHRISVLPVPPPVMGALARHPAVDRYDLSSLELIVSGGAPLAAALQRAVAARFPHAAVGQGYGMTETAVAISGPERAAGTPPGSVGRAMAGTELRVVAGELWVRGPQVMRGYKDRPAATAAILDADGWLRTGDLGRIDADGNVYVVDRLKELIKVDAHQVAPAELEALLLTHPGVADAAVVGLPDDRHGEAPVAFVVGDAGPDALMAWVADRVAPWKRIRTVVAVPRSRARRRERCSGGSSPAATATPQECTGPPAPRLPGPHE